MSDFSWWPGLVALAAGLGGGLLLARRFRVAGAERGELERRNVELRRADLVARRDEIYSKLRSEGAELGEAGRKELELAAARALRDLDAVDEELGRTKSGKSRRKRHKGDAGKTSESGRLGSAPVPAQGFSARHPLVSGFLLGAGMVGIIGLLVFWAAKDPGREGSASSGERAEQDHPEISLPAEAQAELETLQSQLEQTPGDVRARKQLALLYLSFEQYFPAFQEARTLLELDPQDIDGLYVEAVVRLQMGQTEPALERFERVLELFPDHVQALAWRGVILYQGGDVSAAIESWERGIQAAGGQHPELEQMVNAALAEEAGLTPVAQLAAPPPAEEPPPEQRISSADASAGFPVRVEIGAGQIAPNGGVLFVALRGAEGAPPVAVQRLADASFPLDLVVSAADSMMGGELPESGFLTARLDTDGDVSTQLDGDLGAQAAVVRGETVVLTLVP